MAQTAMDRGAKNGRLEREIAAPRKRKLPRSLRGDLSHRTFDLMRVQDDVYRGPGEGEELATLSNGSGRRAAELEDGLGRNVVEAVRGANDHKPLTLSTGKAFKMHDVNVIDATSSLPVHHSA